MILKKQFIEHPSLNIQGDDTMEQWFQYLKFELLPGGHEDQPKWLLNLCFDRVHKKNPKLSKPVGHIQFSMRKVLDIAINALAVASVIHVKDMELLDFVEVKDQEKEAIDFMYGMLRNLVIPSAESRIRNLLREIKRREEEEGSF